MSKLTVTVETKTNNQEIEYPFLGISKEGRIVLFRKFRIGIVIFAPKNDVGSQGYFSETWDMVCFEPFTGSITLTQT